MEADTRDPLVTVVIPTFNRSTVVTAAIASVLAQRERSLEVVVVVDDGSSDGTLELLAAEPDPRVRLVAADHRGVCAARNRGAAEARGRWLTFLDSDDSVDTNWLTALLRRTDERTPLATCAATLHYPDGAQETRAPTPLGPAFGSVTAHFLAGTFLVTTELFRSVGGYLEDLTYSENTDLGMRLGVELERRGERAGVEPDSHLRVSAVQRTYDADRYYRAGVALLDRSGALLARDRHLLATYLAITGVAAGRCGHTAEARRLLLRAWRAEPSRLRHLAQLFRSQVPIQRLR